METAPFINHIKQIRPLHDHVIVTEMNFHQRTTSGGIIIPGDDARSSGVRPRWAKVLAIGPEQQDVEVGDWICVAHGRWTRGVAVDFGDGSRVIRRVDNDDILLVSKEQPSDDILSDKV